MGGHVIGRTCVEVDESKGAAVAQRAAITRDTQKQRKRQI